MQGTIITHEMTYDFKPIKVVAELTDTDHDGFVLKSVTCRGVEIKLSYFDDFYIRKTIDEVINKQHPNRYADTTA